MENCLVTQLKGVVDNNNLPELNTVYIDYIGTNIPLSIQSGDKASLIVKTGASPVEITTKEAVQFDSQTATPSTHKTAAANTNTILYIPYGTLGKVDIADFIKIEGGIYDLVKLVYATSISRKSCLSFKSTQHNSIASMKYNKDGQMLVLGGTDLDMTSIPDSVGFIVVDNSKSKAPISLEGIPSSVQVIDCSYNKIFSEESADVRFNFISIDASIAENDTIRAIAGFCIGKVTDLPIYTCLLYTNSVNFAGNLIDFVSKAHRSGRKTGLLAMRVSYSQVQGSWSRINFTDTLVDGETVADIPVVDNYIYLSWDAPSVTLGINESLPVQYITWLSAKPAASDAKFGGINKYIPFPIAYSYNANEEKPYLF